MRGVNVELLFLLYCTTNLARADNGGDGRGAEEAAAAGHDARDARSRGHGNNPRERLARKEAAVAAKHQGCACCVVFVFGSGVNQM